MPITATSIGPDRIVRRVSSVLAAGVDGVMVPMSVGWECHFGLDPADDGSPDTIRDHMPAFVAGMAERGPVGDVA